MSFLAPLFLVGALAVAAPIIFHLIRRTTKDRIPISSLMFLQPSPPRVTRRSRIENWLLLILRCLVICLLALGFARPFWERPMAADSLESAGRRVLFLVDISASMQRDNLWGETIQALENELEDVRPEAGAAVYAFGSRVRPIMGFGEWQGLPAVERSAAVMSRLRAIQPSWSETRIGQALLDAVEILEEREKNDTAAHQARIVVFSDLQEGSRLDGLQGYEWPRNIEVDLRPLSARRKTNAGAQILAERRPVSSGSDTNGNQVAVRVTNAADSEREQFRLFWSNGEGAAPAGESVDVYVPPGQSRILDVPLSQDSSQTAKLVLSGDEETFDNQAYYVPPSVNTIPVLFMGQSAPNDPQGMHYYLARAFQDAIRHKVEIRSYDGEEGFSMHDLDGVRLAIVTRSLSVEGLQLIKSFVREGGTLLMALSSTAMFNTLAALADAEALQAAEARVNRYAMLGQIDFTHPLFAPFADPRYSDFTKIHFWKHRDVATNGLSGARVVARFDDGAPALLELPLGRGHAFVMTSGWQPADSQLALSSKFVPLLYSLLDYSGALPSGAAAYFVGDEVPLRMHAENTAATVRAPDGTETNLTDAVYFEGTDQPGIYTVISANGTNRFAVNVAPEESRTAALAKDALESLGVPVSFDPALSAVASVREARQLHATELESRQKLWRWLLAAALGLLLIEIWLAGRLSRRPVAEPA